MNHFVAKPTIAGKPAARPKAIPSCQLRRRRCQGGSTSATTCRKFCVACDRFEAPPTGRVRCGLTFLPRRRKVVNWFLSTQQPLLRRTFGMESTRWSRLALLYASTIFLSAFLLFQVQPLISRFILPWFGGGPAIWTTCLLFFQTVLFAGYAYAHVSEHSFGPKARTVVHLTLLVAALLTLPITPSDWWKPTDSGYPTARILALTRGLRRTTLLRSLVDRATGAGLVQSNAAGPIALSALFALEFGFASGAIELSVCVRAGLGRQCSRAVVDRRLRGVLHLVRHGLLVDGPVATHGNWDSRGNGASKCSDGGEE